LNNCLEGRGKEAGTGRKKLTRKREPIEKEEGGEPGEEEKEYYQTIPNPFRFKRYGLCSLLPLVLETPE
jgi:hypothetical protein